MAPVTFEGARAVREEAERLRVASVELRLSVRASNRTALARREKATEAAVARDTARRSMTSGSPWSGLAWRRDVEDLARALVPVD
jgi:hypothetical protein